MKNIQEIKKQSSEDTNKFMDECGVFWAFSNQQFLENKTVLKEGEKYISIGAGGYMPKGNAKKLTEGLNSIAINFKKSVAENKQREAHILYELNNHEAFYTCEIDETLDVLGSDYTSSEVQAVYKKYKSKKTITQTQNNNYV